VGIATVRLSSPVATSQYCNCIQAPVMTCSPSVVRQTEFVPHLKRPKSCTSLPVATSHSFREFAVELAVASLRPSAENADRQASASWARIVLGPSAGRGGGQEPQEQAGAARPVA
jgi:hypothetical protein